jgi:hypothetical protein
MAPNTATMMAARMQVMRNSDFWTRGKTDYSQTPAQSAIGGLPVHQMDCGNFIGVCKSSFNATCEAGAGLTGQNQL